MKFIKYETDQKTFLNIEKTRPQNLPILIEINTKNFFIFWLYFCINYLLVLYTQSRMVNGRQIEDQKMPKNIYYSHYNLKT